MEKFIRSTVFAALSSLSIFAIGSARNIQAGPTLLANGPGIPMPPLPKNPPSAAFGVATLELRGPGIPMPPLPKNPPLATLGVATLELRGPGIPMPPLPKNPPSAAAPVSGVSGLAV
jgi:hypothetical protein